MVVTREGKVPALRDGDVDEFGALLYELMKRRDIRNPSELTKALTESGYPVSRQTVVNYATGETPVSTPFIAASARLLQLGKRDMTALAYIGCYGKRE